MSQPEEKSKHSFETEQEKKDYWLIVKDVDEVGEPEIKLPFTINLVFSSDFDF